MLFAGTPFPNFSLPDQDGNLVTLDDLKGGRTIVYFYPKDDTPGCTTEACEINQSLPDFAGARVFGVSPDSPKSHRKFVDKFGLGFTLLADEEHKLAEACGVWVEKSMYGKNYMGVQRSTFLLDENGIINKVWEKVTPKDHAKEILESL
ncbi:thioredoxin-dependent thiol peroxidase [bacterium]|nr:MAG: thioredoxin-dependent thiol peroxidase [bacterium]